VTSLSEAARRVRTDPPVPAVPDPIPGRAPYRTQGHAPARAGGPPPSPIHGRRPGSARPDKVTTLAKLKELVGKGESHYIQLGGGMGGGNTLSARITVRVEKNGTAVKRSAYDKSASSGSTSSGSASESGSNSGSDSGSGSGAQSAGRSASTLHRLDPADVG
jgi:hypothetical protein